MASPQPENGLTSIAHEIVEHLAMMKLSGNQWQVLMIIFRKTYGWHKKSDYIANCQIIEATGLGKSVVSRSLELLEKANIITRNGRTLEFQKDWEKWQPELAKRLTKVSHVANKLEINHVPKVSQMANNNNSEKLATCQLQLAKRLTKVSHTLDTQRVKVLIQKKVYGELKNVTLSDEQYEKLKTKFNGTLDDKIETLSLWLASTGKKRPDHYATILSWARRDEKDKQLTKPPFKSTYPMLD